MTQIRVANAPCSWGALEFEGLEGESIGYAQMLTELVETGYTGTELGDWEYMPTEPNELKAELEQRDLALLGAFVPVVLKNPEAHALGEANALKVAQLLAAATKSRSGSQQPLVILADANGTDAIRTRNAGRIQLDMELSSAQWEVVAYGTQQIARAIQEVTGLKTVFHHHCAGYIETPVEIAHFLAMTDPELVGLVFDTGHYLYGTGQTDGRMVMDALERFGPRIKHIHFKDCQPLVAEQARTEGWDYFAAVQHGVFCELGKGNVPFDSVAKWLHAHDYEGWIVVEQDVLPGMGSPKASAERNRQYLRAIGI